MRFGALFKHWSLRLLTPDRVVQRTYEAFKTLLGFDGTSHELMAEFEALYHEGRREDLSRTRSRYRRFAQAVEGMVTALEQMGPAEAGALRDYYNKYDFYLRLLLAPPEAFLIPPFVVAHNEVVDPGLVGNKSSALLRARQIPGVRIPEGFTITAPTFGLLMAHNQIRPAIDLLLSGIDPASISSLETASQALMSLIRQMEIPDQVGEAILAEYDRLAALTPGKALRVAVRSSALSEDGEHSFAGQYQSVLGVDRDGLLDAYLEVVASKYSPQALFYRIHAGFGDEEAAMAVLVLAMVDAVASGVVYTSDPVTGDSGLQIHAIHGLGLPLVGGETVPAIFVTPPGSESPVQATAGNQHHQLILSEGRLHEATLVAPQSETLPVNRDQAGVLAHLARELERLFDRPQDIEWAMDGQQRFFILQSRPLRLEGPPSLPPEAMSCPYEGHPLLIGGRRAAGSVACGTVCHLDPLAEEFVAGTVLVTRHIPPSLVRHVPKLAAVICEQGSVTGHFATVCREFGVVLLVEAPGALAALPQGAEVTVDAHATKVYAGRVAELLAKRDQGVRLQPPVSVGKLRQLHDYITPLHLLDPASPDFRPQSCRSLHDIIRYAHEKAVQIMFGLGGITGGASSRSRKLQTSLPLDIYLVDVGDGLAAPGGETVALEAVRSTPFLALWQGLSRPEIDWQSHAHFDWREFGDAALSGGVVAGGAKSFASYAVVGADYCNLNMRFGFHFTLIDCLCGGEARANYCQLRFAGGGGEYRGRAARVDLLQRILGQLGFEVKAQGDLLDARLIGFSRDELWPVLVEVGRMLGQTKLLDMTLHEEEIEQFADKFLLEAGSPR